MADIIIIAALIVIVVLIVRGQVKRHGRGQCTGGCAGCPGCGHKCNRK